MWESMPSPTLLSLAPPFFVLHCLPVHAQIHTRQSHMKIAGHKSFGLLAVIAAVFFVYAFGLTQLNADPISPAPNTIR